MRVSLGLRGLTWLGMQPRGMPVTGAFITWHARAFAGLWVRSEGMPRGRKRKHALKNAKSRKSWSKNRTVTHTSMAMHKIWAPLFYVLENLKSPPKKNAEKRAPPVWDTAGKAIESKQPSPSLSKNWTQERSLHPYLRAREVGRGWGVT